MRRTIGPALSASLRGIRRLENNARGRNDNSVSQQLRKKAAQRRPDSQCWARFVQPLKPVKAAGGYCCSYWV